MIIFGALIKYIYIIIRRFIMRKLSKLLAVGAILTLGLTACGSNQKPDTSAESTKADASGAAEESTKAEVRTMSSGHL